MNKLKVHFCDEHGIRSSKILSGQKLVESYQRESISIKAVAWTRTEAVFFLFDHSVDLDGAADIVRDFCNTSTQPVFDVFMAEAKNKEVHFDD
jgi:hypothetical protein